MKEYTTHYTSNKGFTHNTLIFKSKKDFDEKIFKCAEVCVRCGKVKFWEDSYSGELFITPTSIFKEKDYPRIAEIDTGKNGVGIVWGSHNGKEEPMETEITFWIE